MLAPRICICIWLLRPAHKSVSRVSFLQSGTVNVYVDLDGAQTIDAFKHRYHECTTFDIPRVGSLLDGYPFVRSVLLQAASPQWAPQAASVWPHRAGEASG